MSSQLGSGEDPIILSDSESESVAEDDNDVHDNDEHDNDEHDNDEHDNDYDNGSSYEDSPEPYEATGARRSWNGSRSSTRMTDDKSSQSLASSPFKTRKNKATASYAPPPRNFTRRQGVQTDLAALRTEELYGE
jgi:hypothetical protein